MNFQCHECPFETNIHTDMRRHTERHEEALFTCFVCNMPFRTKNHLTAHKRQIHSIGKLAGKFVKHCELCPYTTSYSGDIARHRRKHRMTDFHCKYCNYPFANEHIMKVHEHKNHESKEAKKAIKRIPRRSEVSTSKHRYKRTNPMCHDTSYKRKKLVHEKKREHSKQGSSKHRVSGSAHYKTIDEHTRADKTVNASYNVHHEQNYSERNIRLNKNDILCVKTSNEHYREKHKGHKSLRYHSEKTNKRNTKNRHGEFLKPMVRFQVKENESKSSIDDEMKESDQRKINVSAENSDISLSSMEDIGISLEPGDSSDDGLKPDTEFETMTVMLPDNTLTEAMRCRKCIFFTTNRDEFSEHTELHTRGPFTCTYCKMPFRLQEHLDKHMMDKHDSDSDSTDTSKGSDELNVSERKSLDQGTECLYDKNEMSCVFCNFKTQSYLELRSHIDDHLDNEAGSRDKEIGERAGIQVETDEHHEGDQSPAQECEYEKEAPLKSENVEDDGYYYTATRIDTGDVFSTNQSSENETEKEEKQSVTGRLDKESFKKTKKLYAEVLDGDRMRYECLVCEERYVFDTSKSIWQHFKKQHKKLRRRICNSCPYCSKSFPKKPQ